MIFRLSLLITTIMVGAIVGFTQDSSNEIAEQVPLILNALNQNNTLKDKIQENCVIAVLFNPESTQSETEKKSLVEVIDNNKKIKVFGKKIKLIEVPVTHDMNLEKKIIINKINAFWLTSDLQSVMNNIRESAKYNQVITISVDNNLVNQSMVAMSTQKTASGYKVMVNMSEANNINLDLNQKLLGEAILIE